MFSRFHVNSWVKGVSTTEGRKRVSMRRTEGKEEWEKEESIWRERTAHAEENHADMGLCAHERLAGGRTKAGLAKSVCKSSFSWVFEKWPHCAVWVGMMFEILLPQCPGVLSRLADVHLWAQICKSTTLLGGKSGVEGGGSPCWGLGGACSDHAEGWEEPVLTGAGDQALPGWAPHFELFWICTRRRTLTAPGTEQRILRRSNWAMGTNTLEELPDQDAYTRIPRGWDALSVASLDSLCLQPC